MLRQLGRYEITTHLSTGGMAEVYLARHRSPDGFEKRVALKVLLPELAEDPALVERFRYEAQLAARLSHPNICQVFDFGVDEGRHYMVLEYLEGQTLGRVVRRGLREGTPLPPPLVAHIGACLAEALDYAHELRGAEGEPLGVVHRDVSPGNVMITYDGQVKLLDFGIASAIDRKFRTRTGEIRGKLAYLAPEQLREERADARTDLFSLGVVLHEAIIGRSPFEAHTELATLDAVLRSPAPPLMQVPQALADTINALLSKEPSLRPSTARAVSATLESIAGSLPREHLRRHVEALFKRERINAIRPQSDADERLPRRKTVSLSDRGPAFQKRLVVALSVTTAFFLSAWAIWRVATPTPPKLGPAVSPVAIPVVPTPIEPPSAQPPPSLVNTARAPTRRPAEAFQGIREKPGQKLRGAVGAGTLTLDTTPWAEVFLEGKRLGTTPLYEAKLPAGRHRLRLWNPDAKSERVVEVVIVDGQLTTRKIAW